MRREANDYAYSAAFECRSAQQALLHALLLPAACILSI